MNLTGLIEFLLRGGPALWAIALLSVVLLALILWRLWSLVRIGAWQRSDAETMLDHWRSGQVDDIRAKGPVGQVAKTAIAALNSPDFGRTGAEAETTRIAKAQLAEMRVGLRAFELISTIAPLIGLLGTVLGMIEAFQALQDSGAAADPSVLAGGIWEALLTTAAGMAVAIPATMALVWFEAQADKVQAAMEDIATRIFTQGPKTG